MQSLPMRVRLTLQLLSLGLVALLSSIASAQRPGMENRFDGSDKPETRFQRWLPLPDGKSQKDFDIDDLLAKARSPMSNGKPTDGSANEEANVKRLREIIKQLGDKLPQDAKPPALDGVSAEAIAKALKDPEVRKQAEKIVEQYVKQTEEKRERDRAQNSDSSSRSIPKSSSRTENDPARQPKPRSNENPFPPGQRPQESALPRAGSPNSGSTKVPSQENATDRVDSNEIDLFDQGPKGKASDDAAARPSREIIQSVEDFLKQVEQRDRNTSETEESKSGDPKDSKALSSGSGTPEAVKKNLNEKGFSKTFNEILDQAKKEAKAKQEATDPTFRKTGPKQTSAPKQDTKSSLSNSKKESTPQVEDRPLSEQTSANPNRENNSPLSSEPSAWGKWFSEMTSSILSKAVEISPMDEPSTAESPDTSWSTDWSSLTQNNLFSPWMVIAAVACIAACIALVLLLRVKRTEQRLQEQSELAKGEYLKQPNKIQSREDVIRAFHELAYRIAHPLEEWATHHRIARRAVRATPEHQSPLSTLVQVYEQARYLPNSVALSEAQLVSVREAIQKCEPNAR